MVTPVAGFDASAPDTFTRPSAMSLGRALPGRRQAASYQLGVQAQSARRH
ncbi:hypothetical protein [Nocardioides convexus]